MRIGVVADTHVGERLAALPPQALAALEGVDAIVHAGDLSILAVLEPLAAIAPVVAVRGNHDDEGGIRGLPRDAVLQIGGWRVGVTHGDRSTPWEVATGVLSLLRGRALFPGYLWSVRRRFRRTAVDVIVSGHIHVPLASAGPGVPVFSPGAVDVPEVTPGGIGPGLGGRAYRRFRRGTPARARVPAVGILELGPGRRARAVRIPLAGPLR